MNLADLEKKLIAVARRCPPDDRVPLAFEKRITALVQTHQVLDDWTFWARGLWRAAAACFAIAMLLGIFSILSPGNGTAGTSDLSDDFENTMLADVNQESEL